MEYLGWMLYVICGTTLATLVYLNSRDFSRWMLTSLTLAFFFSFSVLTGQGGRLPVPTPLLLVFMTGYWYGKPETSLAIDACINCQDFPENTFIVLPFVLQWIIWMLVLLMGRGVFWFGRKWLIR